MKYYIVWNSTKSEGAIFNNAQDAEECYTGEFSTVSSSLANEFFEMYGEDEMHQQIVELIDCTT
jgi:hypothetical protein